MLKFGFKLILKSSSVIKATNQASLTPLMEAGYMVQREAKRSMRRFTGKSSRPGHPPKVRTGRLRRNIRTARDKDGTVIVGPTGKAFYGKFLEAGTKRISARRFMKPAFDKVRNKFPQLWQGKSLAKTPEGRKLNAGRMRHAG
jgi:HK97 gp10 family phage protein